ncbi:hypothetical protein M404DRAFT_129331 [Pisolithus tinctorius Marx 270]|uniref:Uncharacterized protein n=1 Tax=Pisolithus tinctorius Marx 270 TaxID=870435 RepID=A0A0C3JMY4_PISTI|nr:hypothetical protein M404DRAFT_129331 [Pisolithus tinctorius Marx 270]
MDNQEGPLIPIATYLTPLDQPPGSYGISYDIYTQKTEDNLPAGWNSYRGATYNELAYVLQQIQYSDWVCLHTDAIDTYWAMLSLLWIQPPGKLQSTIKGLKMHHISDWTFDVTHQVQLGGYYSPHLQGPTPAGLVPANVPSFLPLGFQPLPRYTQESEEAMNLINWRVSHMI